MTELYDLENDWAEKKNIAADHPDVVQRLSQQLDAWKSSLPIAPSQSSLFKARMKPSKGKGP